MPAAPGADLGVGAAAQPLDADVVRGKGPSDLGNVVVLDLPDIDSLEAGHRAAVEAVLPKVDVVAWVTDPEKYADAVLHDDFLRDWLARLDRQIVRPEQGRSARRPRRRGPSRRSRGVSCRREVPVARAADARGDRDRATDGAEGVAELRRWLAEAVDAKAIVADRLVAGRAAALADLAGRAGVASGATRAARVRGRCSAASIDAATTEVLRVVDLPGVERQAVAATRASARRRGTGPIGLLTSAIYRATGSRRGHPRIPRLPARLAAARRPRAGGEVVRRPIERCPAGGAAGPAIPATPPRPGPATSSSGSATSVDRVVARQPPFEPPTSRFWPLIGLLQTANTLLLVFAAAWMVLWVIARPEVACYDLPVLGPCPRRWCSSRSG